MSTRPVWHKEGKCTEHRFGIDDFTGMTGNDISAKMIEVARKEEERCPLGIRYFKSSFSNLTNFEKESFDLVVSTMALMDGPGYEGALQEANRVLKSNGKIFFSITHPCFMTRGFSWIKDEENQSRMITVSHYFSEESWDERWTFSKSALSEGHELFTVPRFPLTLSEYINGLIRNGFNLLKIEEPRPTEEKCEAFPWLKRWREHAALFAYFAAEKSGHARRERAL